MEKELKPNLSHMHEALHKELEGIISDYPAEEERIKKIAEATLLKQSLAGGFKLNAEIRANITSYINQDGYEPPEEADVNKPVGMGDVFKHLNDFRDPNSRMNFAKNDENNKDVLIANTFELSTTNAKLAQELASYLNQLMEILPEEDVLKIFEGVSNAVEATRGKAGISVRPDAGDKNWQAQFPKGERGNGFTPGKN